MNGERGAGTGYLIILSVLVLTGLAACNTSSQNNGIDRMTLEHVLSFPEEEGPVSLRNPISFTFSERDIFISDQFASAVYQFDLQGNFIRQIGNPGSGPEEFMMQGRISYDDNRLFVNDQGNGRFTIILLEENTFHSYLLPVRPIEFIPESRSGTLFMILHNTDRESVERLPLIRSYDFELKEKTSFGNYLRLVSNATPSASDLYMRIYEGHLYVLFKYYPILHIYTLNGELIHTVTFDAFYDVDNQNYQEKTFADPSFINTRRLFSGFDITEEGMFFYVYNGTGILIDHFDHEEVFKGRFEKDLDGLYEVWDMEVEPQENGDLFFYLLNIDNGFPKVDLYRGKREETS